jgi:hypothetical protein
MSYEIFQIPNSGSLIDGKLSIAVSNVHVQESNIFSSATGSPNVSGSRHSRLITLLNQALEVDGRVDLLILPEVSVPHSYLPLMQRFCRMRQIGLIFGLEHRLISHERPASSDIGTAYNHVVTLLPNRQFGLFRTCHTHRRLKRHYAPGETRELLDRRVALPSGPREPYPLFHWRGVYLTVFNCYELANVEDRSKFRSKIDFMVTVEWNPDTNYFSNLAESTARDLHCYFVQVNTSQYGDSRIVSPSKSDRMNLLRTKGGKNETLLVGELNIEALRQFQSLAPSGQSGHDHFKMTPPDFSLDEIDNRVANRRPFDSPNLDS